MNSNRRPLKVREARWAHTLAEWLARRRVTPNAISVAGMGFATLGVGCYGAASRSWWLGLLALPLAAGCVQLRLVCNLLDGLVAVEGGLKGHAGDLFNEAPDRYEDVVLLAAAGWAAHLPVLGWVAATLSVVTAYLRVLGASLGQGHDFSGPLAKQQRMFFLTIGSLAGALWRPLLGWALVWIAIGTLITILRRAARLYAKLP